MDKQKFIEEKVKEAKEKEIFYFNTEQHQYDEAIQFFHQSLEEAWDKGERNGLEDQANYYKSNKIIAVVKDEV